MKKILQFKSPLNKIPLSSISSYKQCGLLSQDCLIKLGHSLTWIFLSPQNYKKRQLVTKFTGNLSRTNRLTPSDVYLRRQVEFNSSPKKLNKHILFFISLNALLSRNLLLILQSILCLLKKRQSSFVIKNLNFSATTI